jgi:hypothetical protein
MDRKAKMYQSLVTIEALSATYDRMKLLLDELPEIDLLFRLSNEEDARRVYQADTADPIARRRDHDVPSQTNRCRERQKLRLSLPLLPFFPDDSFQSAPGGETRSG